MATWDRYKKNVTGLEIIAQRGANFQPRFFCDDSTTVYTTKSPVAKLKLTPAVQFINTNIAWDVSQSDSATGTLDTWDLSFGGGGATDLASQDWGVDPSTGNVQYTTVGRWDVSLTVTDTLGNRSAPATATVYIVDLVSSIGKLYIATADSGLFTYLPGGTPTQSNTGLTGGDLNFTSGKLNPHFAGLPNGFHHYWACTDNGLVYTVDGGASWNAISAATLDDPTNSAGDGTPPDTDDLYQVCVEFCPQDLNRVYCYRATDATWNASNSPRIFLYWSDNYGTTWDSIGVGV